MVSRLCTVLAFAFIQSLALSDDVSFTVPSLSNDAKEAGTELLRRRIQLSFLPKEQVLSQSSEGVHVT